MNVPNGETSGSGPLLSGAKNPVPQHGSSSKGHTTPASRSAQPSNGGMMTNGQFTPPVGDTNAAAFLADRAKAKSKPNPLPISSLRTGFCYDIRMRFHQTVDYRDTHPEDPRRIYRIYKELALAGLIEDRETQSVSKDELMLRLRARHATEEEVLLVHSKEHLAEMQATESTPTAERKLI
jgi:hypothetical protein